MITGIKLSRVEAHRDKDDEITGLSINISVDSVSVKSGEVAIGFSYSATYAEGVGELKVGGTVTSKEDPKFSR